MKWTKRFREARRDDIPRERVNWPVFVLLLLFMAGIFYAANYPYLKKPPLIERDFTGRVVDKFLTIAESDRGSRPVMRLLVEDRQGKRGRVGVTGELYERARVGMWVSRRGGELKLHSNEPEPEPAPHGGEGPGGEAR